MKVTEPGIYDLTDEQYHADPCDPASLSSSGARQLTTECPAKFWYDRCHPGEPRQVLDVGKAAHQWVLEGVDELQGFQVLPEDHNGRTKAGKALVEEIEAAGLRPLRHEDFEAIKGMREAMLAHPYAAAAFEGCEKERSLFWRDPEFGIWCRTKPDALPGRHEIVADYKTTISAEPDYLRKALYNYGYHQQAEWYVAGIRELGILEAPRFLFVFQEKVPPYVVTCITPSRHALEWGQIANRKARETFARCLDAGHWPAYADDILTVDLPVWAEHRLMDRHEKGDFELAADFQSPQAAE